MSDTRQLLLHAIWRPSLAFYTWAALNTFDICNDAAGPADWAKHAQLLCLQDERFTTLFADKQMLSECLDASPVESLQLSVSIHPCKLLPVSITNVKQPVQPLLLLLQELTGIKASESAIASGDSTKSSTFQRRRRQTTPVPPASSRASVVHARQQSQPASCQAQCGPLVVLLRSMLLLLKLLDLLQQVTAITDSSRSVTKLLWQTVVTVVKPSRQQMGQAGPSRSNQALCSQSQCDLRTEAEEQQRLSVMLVLKVLPMMQHGLHDEAGIYPAVYLTILSFLLQTGLDPVVQAVAAELIRPGKCSYPIHRHHLTLCIWSNVSHPMR